MEKVWGPLACVRHFNLDFLCRTLYNDNKATVPKLAEKLTLELVHHIEVTFGFTHYHYSSVDSLVTIVCFFLFCLEISSSTGTAD